MTSSIRIGCSTARRLNASTHWIVSVDTRPSAPSPTRAQANTSGSSSAEQATSEPSPVTSSRPASWVARPPKRAPVPWVAVATAPAIDW